VGALDSEDIDIAAVVDCLQSDSPTSGQEGEPPWTRLARIKAQQLVLKLQRMGGGNNTYREASLRFWTIYMQKNVRHGLQWRRSRLREGSGVPRACSPLERKR
jgi:hypothetical protein